MYRILVIDDIDDNLELLTSILEAMNYDVQTAADGQQAISKLCVEEYDLVVTDVIMPICDGYEVAKFIREELHASSQSIPIIAMSGGGAMLTKEIALSGIKLFANEVIKKPFSVEDIEETVTNLLQKKTIPDNLHHNLNAHKSE